MATSFRTDIAPMFAPFRANMIWRFDITNYDAVKANSKMIFDYIQQQVMPPPPMPPLSAQQVELFGQWMAEQFPP